MRNLKKLFAVIMAVAMLASIMVPALAADSFDYEADAKKLYDLGLFKGTSETSYEPDLSTALTRETGLALMIRAMGKEEEVKAMTSAEVAEQLAKVVDKETINSWAEPYVAYAVKNGLTDGIDTSILPNIKFGGQIALSGQEFIYFMLKAMGYTKTDVPWDDALNKAVEIGMLTPSQAVNLGRESEIIRDDAIGIIAGSMVATTASGVTLAQKLVDDGVIAIDAMAAAGYIAEPTATPTPTPVVLAVESVTADNAKEIVVVFNQEVDKDTVKTDNLKLKKDGVTVADYTVALKDDKTTVVITAKDGTAFVNQATYSLAVSNIKDLSGGKITATTVDVKIFDATLPEVKGIKFTGPKSLEIEFSEPIADAGTRSVSVKSGTTTIGVNSASFAGYNTNKIKVDLYTALTDAKDYTITIKGFEDFAGYGMINYTTDVSYAADKSDIIASIDKAEQTYVVVKFNKPVVINGTAKDYFYHTFSAWKPINVYTDANMTAVVGATAVDKIYVKFADGSTGYPIPEGTAQLVIKEKAGDSYIKDNWDNKFAGATLEVTVTADKTPPSVTELTVSSETALKVKFDENVAFTKDNVEVLNADGSKNDDISITVTGSGKEFTINLGTNMAGKSILVNIKNVEDKALSPNKLALYTQTLDVTDKTAPLVTKVTKKIITGGEQALYVFYNEAMGDSALNKANYYFKSGDTWKRASNTPEFYDGDKVVRIELTNTEKGYLDSYDFVIMNVKDAAGNELISKTTLNAAILDYDDASNAPEVTKVVAKSTTTVEVTFNQYLTEVDATAFKVNGAAVVGMSLSTNSDGNTVVTLTANDANKFNYDKSGGSVAIDTADDRKVANIFGVNAEDVTKNAAAITDKIAPAIKSNGITTMDVDGNGKIDHIKIAFEEVMKFNYVSIANFEVADYTIIDAYAALLAEEPVAADVTTRHAGAGTQNSANIFITVEEKTTTDTSVTPKVKVKGILKDLADNDYVVKDDAISSVDKAAPTYTLSGTLGTATDDKWAPGETLVITFSEEVTDETVEAVIEDFDAIAPAALIGTGTVEDDEASDTSSTYTVAVVGGKTVITILPDSDAASTDVSTITGADATAIGDVEDLKENTNAAAISMDIAAAAAENND